MNGREKVKTVAKCSEIITVGNNENADDLKDKNKVEFVAKVSFLV